MKGGHSQRRRFSLVIYLIFISIFFFFLIYIFNDVIQFAVIDMGINSKRFASSSHRLAKKSHRASMAISSQWTAAVHWKKKQLRQDQQVNALVIHHHPIGKAEGVVHFPPNHLFSICPAAASHPVAI